MHPSAFDSSEATTSSSSSSSESVNFTVFKKKLIPGVILHIHVIILLITV